MLPDQTPHTRSDLRKQGAEVVSCDVQIKTAPAALARCLSGASPTDKESTDD